MPPCSGSCYRGLLLLTRLRYILPYTWATGLPGVKKAMVAPRKKKCEKHFPSGQNRCCTGLDFFLGCSCCVTKDRIFFSPLWVLLCRHGPRPWAIPGQAPPVAHKQQCSACRSVGALLVGLRRRGALVGGCVVLFPVVFYVVVVATMSGGSRPPALVPVIAGLCRSLGPDIYSHIPGQPACRG